MTQYESLTLTLDNQIALLKINRPKALNALNTTTLKELLHVFESINHGDIDAKVLILTGEGEKSFVAGADIKEMADLNALESRSFSQFGNHVMMTLQHLRIPTIAAVNGFALGGGLELALSCDIRYASDNAMVGLPEVGLGVIPGFGGTQRLTRLIGLGKANELIFTGRNVKAPEALELGIFNKVFAQPDLLTESLEVAKTIASKAPIAVQFAKVATNKGIEMPLADSVNYESELFGLLFSTHDQKEGMGAFVEKRKASFKNE